MEAIKQPKSYHDLKGSPARITICQGGTRSGKTYSILQVLIEYCFMHKHHRLKIEIVRKTFTSLNDTAMADFFEILVNEGYYQESLHNKSRHTYQLFGNTIKFTGVDQAQKKRGSKRDILFVNEANDLTWDEFFQLNIRCKMKTIIDYNPSMDEDHWIYDKVLSRPDCDFFITTYKDNPFLSATEIHEIEMLKYTDPYYWSVFGLGEKAKNPARIFTFHELKNVPDGCKFMGYGMDFGFTNSPTVLIGVWQRKIFNEKGDKLLRHEMIVEQIIYRHGMTNQDLNEEMKLKQISKRDVIYADSEDPKSIEELRRMGWRVIGAKKPRDSIGWGINYIKQHQLMIISDSIEVKKDFQLYKYKQDKNGKVTNDPVKAYDHSPDALRYLLVSTAYKGRYAVQ